VAWWWVCLQSTDMIAIRSFVPASRRGRVLTALSGALALAAATFVFSVKSAPDADAAGCSSTYLSLGSRGTCVEQLQRHLGALSVDGIYGSGTQSRVRSFQDDAGIAVDGRVGPQTWAKLAKYGKALAWRSGFTLYMCKASSTRFQYSMWNNSGREAWWRLFMAETYLDGPAIADDRIVIQGTIPAGARDSKEFWVFHSRDEKYSTTNVRDFSSSTLPACG